MFEVITFIEQLKVSSDRFYVHNNDLG